jgi:hypothetical protein
MVRTPEPHHLEGEGLLVEVLRGAKPNGQVDLPERLDAFARCNAMEWCRAGPWRVQADPHQP